MDPEILLRFPSLPLAFGLLLLIATPISSLAADFTIYDHLDRHGLPMGLLPKGITEFSLDPVTGKFTVMLPQPCNAKVENELHYDLNVTGTLSFAQIADLSGMAAQELFLWFPVKGIRVDVPSSGVIYFDVGVIDKQFSLSLFESPPDCTASGGEIQSVTEDVLLRTKNQLKRHGQPGQSRMLRTAF